MPRAFSKVNGVVFSCWGWPGVSFFMLIFNSCDFLVIGFALYLSPPRRFPADHQSARTVSKDALSGTSPGVEFSYATGASIPSALCRRARLQKASSQSKIAPARLTLCVGEPVPVHRRCGPRRRSRRRSAAGSSHARAAVVLGPGHAEAARKRAVRRLLVAGHIAGHLTLPPLRTWP